MSRPKINLQILTPEKIACQDKVDQVSVPTKDGEITILPNHIPLVSLVAPGELVIKNDSKKIPMAVWGGFVKVRPPDKVIIMTDVAERVEEIDEKKAEEARQKAESALKKKDRLSDVDFANASAILEKSLTRLRIVKKYRRRN